MVKPLMSFGRSGLQDWIVQRLSAVVLAIYTAFLFGYFITHSNFNYETWRTLFTFTWMRYASLLALFSLVMHAWIGIWTVITDYVKPVGIRLIVHVMVVVALLFYLVWGVYIIWGI